MKEIIYSDEKREIRIEGRSIYFSPKVPGKSEMQREIKGWGNIPDLRPEKVLPPSPDTVKLQKENGNDVSACLSLPWIGGLELCFGAECGEAVKIGLKKYWEEKEKEDIESERIANLPENKERREIDNLFFRAEKIENSPREDNVSLPLQLRAEARARLKIWREKYPASARAERKSELLGEAARQESLASGALTFDMDGWLSRTEQEKRAEEFKAKARELRAEAEKL